MKPVETLQKHANEHHRPHLEVHIILWDPAQRSDYMVITALTQLRRDRPLSSSSQLCLFITADKARAKGNT